MARGKSAAAKARAVAPPAPVPTVSAHAQHYLCSACRHHHGRYTKIGLAHRQYRTEKKV